MGARGSGAGDSGSEEEKEERESALAAPATPDPLTPEQQIRRAQDEQETPVGKETIDDLLRINRTAEGKGVYDSDEEKAGQVRVCLIVI
jgi:hypothetical protein